MAETLLVAGTASHVGKSTVAAGLCRLLADRGIDVAPFKAQNMSNNARAVPKATAARRSVVDAVAATDDRGDAAGERSGRADAAAASPERDGVDAFGEIGVSQYVQARAARVPPTTDHNPVLLKPRGDAESQLVLDGEAIAHYEAGEYYDDHWERARETARAAHERLASAHEVVIAEGAGSIAEPNLRERDLANLETARFADADVLLVADIERGGVFASVLGTVELLPEDVRERVVGVVITKFRGDESLLESGIAELEARTGVPVLGVLPYDDPGLPAEDSVALPAEDERATVGGDDGVPARRAVTIAVPRLPRISNFTDLEPLAAEPGVRVDYRPLDATYGDADAIVLPGTKNAVDDLLAAREAGLAGAVTAFDGPVVGLCGGYQLLGERITNAAVEGTGERDVVEGFGRLPVETRFSPDKRVRSVTLALDGTGPLSGATGTVAGYEIHMGDTRAIGPVQTPFAPGPGSDATDSPSNEGGADPERRATLGAVRGAVLGTYLHGLFENRIARRAFVESVADHAGVDRPAASRPVESPYDQAAALVGANVDLSRLGVGNESTS